MHARPAQVRRRFDDLGASQVFTTYRRTGTQTDLVNFVQMDGFRFTAVVRPGDTLGAEVTVKKRKHSSFARCL